MASVTASRKPDDEWVDVAPPTPVGDGEDEWVDADTWVDAAPVDRSVANTARSRLSRRGLTPEQVKSGTVTDPGFEYTPRTRDGGFWSNLGRGINPAEFIPAIGKGLVRDFTTVQVGMDAYTPKDPHVSPMPDLVGVYQEASRRGEQGESLAGMYGSATAQALLAGAGIGAGRLIRSAPARAAAAETEYAEAVGATPGPIPPAVREMLDRRMVVAANPAEQAAAQRTQAAAINAQRDAIPTTGPVRGPRGRFQASTDPVAVANAAERATLRSRAQMESNIAQILEAIPETRTALGAAGKGAGKFVKSRLTMASGLVGTTAGWSPKALVTLGPVAVTHLLWSVSKELVKTNQWQTAAPIYKMRFANALMVGDADLAASTGALIASGQAVAADTSTPTPLSGSRSPMSPIERARKELAETGITSEQAAAYRPIASKLLRKGVDPSDEYDTPEDVMGIAKRFLPSLLSKDVQRARQLSSPEATEDAWRLYLGIPQERNTFGVSEFAPSKSKGSAPYYFKINNLFPQLLSSWGMPTPDKTPADSVRDIVRVLDAQGGKFAAYEDTLANYTLTHGRDARGPYIAYYDKWDLAPSVLKDSKLPIEGLVGRPLEIYDRLYYDPETYEPLTK